MSPWKPIATAPRTDVLFVVGWYNGKNQWCADVWSGRYLADEDRRRAAGFYKASPHLDCSPDYWMELPAPPAEAGTMFPEPGNPIAKV